MTDVKPSRDQGRTGPPASGPLPDRRPAVPVRAPLARRLLAEAVGTALLVTVVVGSGIAAQQLSPHDVGLQLLENSTATLLGLAVLILLFGPVSGAHFNPVVSLVDAVLGRRSGHGLPLRDVGAYAVAQTAGAIGGAVLANAMYSLTPVQISGHHRATSGVLLAEVVATAGLIGLIFALARTGGARCRRPRSAPTSGRRTGSPPPPRSPTPRSASDGSSPTPSPGSPPPRCPRSSPPNWSARAQEQRWCWRCTPTPARPRTTSSSPIPHRPDRPPEPLHLSAGTRRPRQVGRDKSVETCRSRRVGRTPPVPKEPP